MNNPYRTIDKSSLRRLPQEKPHEGKNIQASAEREYQIWQVSPLRYFCRWCVRGRIAFIFELIRMQGCALVIFSAGAKAHILVGPERPDQSRALIQSIWLREQHLSPHAGERAIGRDLFRYGMRA